MSKLIIRGDEKMRLFKRKSRFLSLAIVAVMTISTVNIGILPNKVTVDAAEMLSIDSSAVALADNADLTISTADELIAFRNAVNDGNSYSGLTVTLGGNIDLEDEEWTPIGTSSDLGFAGVFDGDGYEISGLYISQSGYDCAGLFGYTGNTAEIRNLAVKGSISGSYTDLMRAGGIAAWNEGTIALLP